MRSFHTISRLLLCAVLLAACSSASPGPATAPEPVTPVITPKGKPAPATVTVSYRYENVWRQVTPLNAHVPAGPGEIRIEFSKPVRQDEVEQSLMEAQPAPVRGAMQWSDGQTLLWRVAQLPPRVDFLLGQAHDQDGLPLPGGLTSVRVGEAPALVELDLAAKAANSVAALPPDILSAGLTSDRKYLNLRVWVPGATRWDWQTADLHMALEGRELGPGAVEGFQPRLPANLESWVLNPTGNMVAGLRPGARGRDLVIADVLGSRQQAIPGFVSRPAGAGNAGVVWSADGARVAALSESPTGSDLVVLDVADRKQSTLATGLPVPAGAARLAWSDDGRFMLAGPVLVDLKTGAQTMLPGDPAFARGAWEPGGARLLYSGRDWEELLLIDPLSGARQSLGAGILVGWSAPGRALVIRWGASATRYTPPGQS